MPNGKLHDIDVFRMEGDTQKPPSPKPPEALRCRVRRFGFQRGRVGCDAHIFVEKLWFLMFQPPPKKGGWNEWSNFPFKKVKSQNLPQKSLEFFFTLEKLRSLWLLDQEVDPKLREGFNWLTRWHYGTMDHFLQTFLNQYHSKQTIPLHPSEEDIYLKVTCFS